MNESALWLRKDYCVIKLKGQCVADTSDKSGLAEVEFFRQSFENIALARHVYICVQSTESM